MKIKSFFRGLFLFSILIFFVGCHKHDHDQPVPSPTILQGQFIDNSVVGLEFKTDTLSGFTDENGNFKYKTGEIIKFFVGDILIGEAGGKSFITPIDLVPGATDETNPQVINLIRFIQTLDDDQNPANGIIILDLVRDEAVGKSIDFNVSVFDFETDSDIQIVISDLTSVLGVSRSLVDSVDAQKHFRDTLFGLLKGKYLGSFSGDDAGTWEITIDCQGKIEGVSVSDEFGSDVISGSVGINGESSIFGTVGTSVFSGIFLFDGNVSGTWTDPSEAESGIFSGARVPGESVFCSLDVVNPSFEISDPFTVFSVGGNFNTTVSGWETTQPVGTFSPSTPGNPFGFNVFVDDVPDGINTIFALGNGGASQELVAVLTENTTYKLEVEVGDRIFMNLPDSHSAELRAGSVVLASGTVTPANGTFTTLSFEYVAKVGDPFGEPLEVRLVTSHSSSDPNGVQINWDNVRVMARTN